MDVVVNERAGRRLRALFDEAWAHRRRRWAVSAALLVTCVAAAAAIVASRSGPGDRAGDGSAAAGIRPLHLSRAPGIGVACPRAANSIACDRVGIAVFLTAPDARLVATIKGFSIVLRNQSTDGCRPDCFYAAYLRRAGLLHGAIPVQPDAGRDRWYGRHPVSVTVRLVATYRDGSRAATTRHVELSPGFG